MNLTTLLSAPKSALGKLLELAESGRLNVDARIWIEDPNIQTEFVAGTDNYTDVFVIVAEPSSMQWTTIGVSSPDEGPQIIGAFEPGRDVLLFLGAEADTLVSVDRNPDANEAMYRYGAVTMPPPYDNTHSAVFVFDAPLPGDVIFA